MLPRLRPPSTAPEEALASRVPCLRASARREPRQSRTAGGSGREPPPALALSSQRHAHRGAIEPQRVAEIGEGVRPGPIVGLHPGVGLRRDLRDAGVEPDGILEHGQHEPLLRLQRAPGLGIVELGRKDGLELVPAAFLGLPLSPARHAAARCKSPATHPKRRKAWQSESHEARDARAACRSACRAGSRLQGATAPRAPATPDSRGEDGASAWASVSALASPPPRDGAPSGSSIVTSDRAPLASAPPRDGAPNRPSIAPSDGPPDGFQKRPPRSVSP